MRSHVFQFVGVVVVHRKADARHRQRREARGHGGQGRVALDGVWPETDSKVVSEPHADLKAATRPKAASRRYPG